MEKLIIFILILILPLPFWWNIQLIYAIPCFILKILRSTKVYPINIKNCSENLLLFDDIMKKYNINYWLSEGTALGAVRDGGFIPWDDDVDVGMFGDQRETFIKYAIPELCKNGFKLVYVVHSDHFFTFFRNNEEIDVDMFRKGGTCRSCRTKWASCSTCDDLLPFLDNIRTINFLGRQFMVPGDSYLEYLYGPTWRTPQKQSLVEKIKQV